MLAMRRGNLESRWSEAMGLDEREAKSSSIRGGRSNGDRGRYREERVQLDDMCDVKSAVVGVVGMWDDLECECVVVVGIGRSGVAVRAGRGC